MNIKYQYLIIIVVSFAGVYAGIEILTDLGYGNNYEIKPIAECNNDPKPSMPDVDGIAWNLDECYYFLDDPNIPYVEITNHGGIIINNPVYPIPIEGFCDETNNGPFCSDREEFEKEYGINFEDDFEIEYKLEMQEAYGMCAAESLAPGEPCNDTPGLERDLSNNLPYYVLIFASIISVTVLPIVYLKMKHKSKNYLFFDDD